MLIDEIRNNWESDIVGHMQPILSLSNSDYPAWTIRLIEEYGVAIPYTGQQEINEIFSNARIYSSMIRLGTDVEQKVLLLTTSSHDIVAPFSTLCAELVNPGEKGVFRKEIEESPVKWWREWKELLGNKSIDERVYDVLGELCVLNYLIEKGEEACWNGPNGASYDIETNNRFVEVKSSVVRGRKEITISNQFQLSPPSKILDLVFCQFEPSVSTGVSINKLVEDLSDKGVNTEDLNQKLKMLGFEEGRSSRNKAFILHSMSEYHIDSTFPSITPSSFTNGVMPKGVIKITYTVDLSGIPSESII